jgi:hypothetical protein
MPTPLIHQVGRTTPTGRLGRRGSQPDPGTTANHIYRCKHEGLNRGAAVVPTARRGGPREHGRQAARSKRDRPGGQARNRISSPKQRAAGDALIH